MLSAAEGISLAAAPPGPPAEIRERISPGRLDARRDHDDAQADRAPGRLRTVLGHAQRAAARSDRQDDALPKRQLRLGRRDSEGQRREGRQEHRATIRPGMPLLHPGIT